MSEPTPDDVLRSLESRCMELELRSEEGKAEVARLQDFVGAYERRISRLERQLDELKQRVENPPDSMPSPAEDAPPHY